MAAVDAGCMDRPEARLRLSVGGERRRRTPAGLQARPDGVSPGLSAIAATRGGAHSARHRGGGDLAHPEGPPPRPAGQGARLRALGRAVVLARRSGGTYGRDPPAWRG